MVARTLVSSLGHLTYKYVESLLFALALFDTQVVISYMAKTEVWS